MCSKIVIVRVRENWRMYPPYDDDKSFVKNMGAGEMNSSIVYVYVGHLRCLMFHRKVIET